jgi:PBP1b-binding outer membrane lipoprotein LpoB
MKKLFLFITAILLLSSCDNTPMEVENPDKKTTLEILKLAEKDTTLVKVVVLDNTLYVLEDNKVTHEVTNHSGAVTTLAVILMILIILIGIVLAINTN